MKETDPRDRKEIVALRRILRDDSTRHAVKLLLALFAFAVISITVAYQSRVPMTLEATDEREDWFHGFYGVEQAGTHSFRWSMKDASIDIPNVGETTPVVVDLSAYAVRYGNRVYTATVTVNGFPVGEIAKSEWRHWRFVITDRSILRPDKMVVGVHASSFVMSDLYPDTGDNRRVGVRLESVEIQPVTTTASSWQEAGGLLTLPPFATLLDVLGLAAVSYVYLRLCGLREKYAWASVLIGLLCLATGVALYRAAVSLQFVSFVAGVSIAIVMCSLANWTVRRWKPHSPAVSEPRAAELWSQIQLPEWAVITCVFGLGVVARIWEFGLLPPGLGQDEASIGYEAFSLLHYGTDRNGFAFPVQLVSWGSGQNVLYAFLSMPFVALGLNPVTTRFPALILGLGSLPVLYYAIRLALGKQYALPAMFLLAVSPWHIILSRWALESNILPFFFLTGFAFFVRSLGEPRWFVVSTLFFWLGLYCYGTTYMAVPLFLLLATLLAHGARHLAFRFVVVGFAVFAVFAFPIGAFLLVNRFGLQSFYLGPFAVPRLPTSARFETLFGPSAANFSDFIHMLVFQDDGTVLYALQGFGYLFQYTFPLILAGIGLLTSWPRQERKLGRALLGMWIGVALLLGVVQPPNINRVNVLFIPFIISLAVFLERLGQRFDAARPVSAYIILAAFALFMRDYETYGKSRLSAAFYEGLLPAIGYAQELGESPICVTESVNMPYIYALFSTQMSPYVFLKSVHYENPGAPFQYVGSMSGYSFGLSNCSIKDTPVFILGVQEPFPGNPLEFNSREFQNFVVYYR